MPQQQPVLFGRTQGTANTQFIQEIETFSNTYLEIIVERSDGLGSGNRLSNIKIDVSADDGINWVELPMNQYDYQTTLGPTSIFMAHLSESSSSGSTSRLINPAVFPKVRITIPALGSGVSAIVNWALH